MEIVNIGKLDYDGSQLHHAFAYEQQGVLGPTISYFIGPANVKEHLVDLEDSLSYDFIKSESMVHFIIEIPEATIRETVVWQRLFMRLIAARLTSDVDDLYIKVDGDDLMIENQKLSVSIATLSRFSGLIHVGININVGPECPVSAIGLIDIGGTENYRGQFQWAELVAKSFADEYIDILKATYKVIEVN